MKSTVEIERECTSAAHAVAKAVIDEMRKQARVKLNELPESVRKWNVLILEELLPTDQLVWRVIEYAERIGMQADAIIGERGELAMAALFDAALGAAKPDERLLRFRHRVDEPIFVDDPVWFRVGTIASSLARNAIGTLNDELKASLPSK